MKRNGYWIWLGPIVDEGAMRSRPAISTAANRWQRGLLGALRTLDQDVKVLSYIPEPVYPRGSLLMEGRSGEVVGVEAREVPYLNLGGVRDISAAFSLQAALNALLAARGKPQAIFSYNAPFPYATVGLTAQESLGSPWLPLIADVPEEGLGRMVHDQRLRRAAGRGYLSWGSYRDDRGENTFHLDGGVEAIRDARPLQSSRRAILFSGTLNRFGGVHLLIDAFKQVRADCELWICGKGADDALRTQMGGDPRILFLGLVSEEELERRSLQASVFVNPRNPHLEANHQNFPSKVLEYLSYGGPVISTWTNGLAPQYRDVLEIVDEPTPSALAAKIEEILNWGPERVATTRARIHKFLRAEKLWSAQANRLMDWAQSVAAVP